MTGRHTDPIPNSFQVPNIYVDDVLPHLSGSETKILLFIVRKTFGWRKSEDRISISQMAEGTGVSPRHAIRGVKTLVAMGVVLEHTESGKTTAYRLQLDGSKFRLPTGQDVTSDEMSPVTRWHGTPDKSDIGTPDKREYTETQVLNPLTETQRGGTRARASTAPPPERGPHYAALAQGVREPQTEAEREECARVATRLARDRIEPVEIARRCQRYRERWPDKACSYRAIERNWGILGEEVTRLPAPIRDRASPDEAGLSKAALRARQAVVETMSLVGGPDGYKH